MEIELKILGKIEENGNYIFTINNQVPDAAIEQLLNTLKQNYPSIKFILVKQFIIEKIEKKQFIDAEFKEIL